jgi:hypothetical protein
MLGGGRSYLEVRVCHCPCPLEDALLSPVAFQMMHASGEASIKVWPLLFLVLIQGVEHLGDKEKAKL